MTAPEFEPGDIVKVKDWPGIGFEKYRVKHTGLYEEEAWLNIIEDGEVSPVRTILASHARLVRKGDPNAPKRPVKATRRRIKRG